MGLDWNFCVICLSGLGRPKVTAEIEGGRGDGDHEQLVTDKEKRSTTIKFLLQNLLTTRARAKSYDQVLKDVLKLAGVIDVDGDATPGRCEVKTEVEDKDTYELGLELEPAGDDGGNMGEGGSDSEDHCLQVCDNCEGTAGRILELHRKLEALQLRLRREVKAVKEAVVRSSGWIGGVNGGAEALDNFSRRFWNGDVGEWSPKQKAKETFEILKAFQTAVNEADYEPFLGFPINMDNPLEEPGTCEDSYLGRVVKTELPESEDDSDSLAGSLHLGDFLDEYVDNPNGRNYTHNLASINMSNIDPSTTMLAGSAKTLSSSSFPTSLPSSDAEASHHVKTEHGEKAPPAPIPSSSKTAKRLYTERKSKSSTLSSNISPQKLKRRVKLKKSKKSKRSTSEEPPTTPAATIQRVGKARRLICDYCGFRHSYLSTFEQHLRGHETEKKSFHCTFPKCAQSFSTKQFHNFHQDQHNGHHKLSCDVCNGWFSIFDLAGHLQTAHQVETVFPCQQCSRSLSSLEAQEAHVDKQHYGNEKKCSVCGSLFQRQDQLLKHLHEVHQAQEQFPCDFEGCEKSYFSQVSLTRHKVSHTDKFVCGTCSRQFTTSGALGIHQRLHTNERPYLCTQCPEALNTKHALKNHMVRCHGAEKFKCQTCGNEYGSSEGLTFHKKMKHSDLVKFCPICNKKLASEHRLRNHMETHSTERKYICEVCGKSFLTSNTCTEHKRIHGEKKYTCTHCNKSFTKAQYLNLHLRTHTGEKPYSCEICGKAFSQRGSVLVHQRKCRPVAPAGTDV